MRKRKDRQKKEISEEVGGRERRGGEGRGREGEDGKEGRGGSRCEPPVLPLCLE